MPSPVTHFRRDGAELSGLFARRVLLHMDARIPLADPMPASPITRPRSFNIRQHRGAQHLHVDIASHHESEYRSTAATDIKRRQLINRDPPAPPPRPSQIPPFYPSIYQEPSLHRFRTSRAQRQRQIRTHSPMPISGLPLPSPPIPSTFWPFLVFQPHSRVCCFANHFACYHQNRNHLPRSTVFLLVPHFPFTLLFLPPFQLLPIADKNAKTIP